MALDAQAFAKAAQLQTEFENRFAHSPNVIGVGLGLNAQSTAPAINVQVTTAQAGRSLPRTFRGLDVVVDVIGEALAY